jgi:hypothetical protein
VKHPLACGHQFAYCFRVSVAHRSRLVSAHISTVPYTGRRGSGKIQGHRTHLILKKLAILTIQHIHSPVPQYTVDPKQALDIWAFCEGLLLLFCTNIVAGLMEAQFCLSAPQRNSTAQRTVHVRSVPLPPPGTSPSVTGRHPEVRSVGGTG